MFQKNFIYYLLQAFPIIIFFAIWEILSLCFGTDNIPHSYDIISTIIKSFLSNPIIKAQGGGEFGYSSHIVSTLFKFLIGLVIGSFFGFVSVMVLYQFPSVILLIDPVLEFFRVIPPLIIIPFILLLFGVTEMSIILIAILYSAYSIFIYTLNGLKNIPKNYYWMSYLYGSNKLQKLLKVQIPAVLPEIVGALRVTTAITLGIVIVAEYMGSPSGIGRVFKFAISFTNINLIIVGIIWAILIAILFDSIIIISFHFLLKWSTRSFLHKNMT